MTPKQREALRFIRDHIRSTGLSPSFDEMAMGLQVKSKSAVARLVDGLEQRGLITRAFGKTRTIHPTARGLALLDGTSVASTTGASFLEQRVALLEELLAGYRAAEIMKDGQTRPWHSGWNITALNRAHEAACDALGLPHGYPKSRADAVALLMEAGNVG